MRLFNLIMGFFKTVAEIAVLLFIGIAFWECDLHEKLRYKATIQMGGNVGVGFFLWCLIFTNAGNQTIDEGLLLSYQNPDVKALYQNELANYFSQSPFVSLYQTVISAANYINVFLLSHLNPFWQNAWVWSFGKELSTAGATAITLIVCIFFICLITYFITDVVFRVLSNVGFILRIIIGLTNALLFQTIAYFAHYEELAMGHVFQGHIYFALVFTVVAYILQVGLYIPCIPELDVIEDIRHNRKQRQREREIEQRKREIENIRQKNKK